ITIGDTDVLKFVTPAPPRDILEIEVATDDPSLALGVRVHDTEMTGDSGRVISPIGESFKRYVSQPPNTSIYLVIWGARNTTGRWRATVRPLKAFDALEPNDDIFSARKVDFGQTLDANIMDYEDSDFYSFESPRSGTVTIELKNESATLIPAITTFTSDRRNSGFGPDVQTPGANLK